ncbi:transcription termination/antitermination protein NusA [Candidatus Parcubacteria bacterium]|nr:MAG: transcription termination/antitermination protein NusA [Candidatus Parcubacteria bacterium]
MSESQVLNAIKQICDEKGISLESVIETIEAALAAAFRKDFGNKMQNIKVEFDPNTTKFKVFDVKTVVEDVPEEVLAELEQKETKKEDAKRENKTTEETEEEKKFNPKTEIQISEAKKLKKDAKLEDVIKTELKVPGDFGRMAAQTAKQVITQKIREAERETLFHEFKAKEGDLVMATVQRHEGRVVLVDLGRTTAIMPQEEQIIRERYSPGDHIKVYILSVEQTTKGPSIIISRSHPNIVKKLFELEIPEIASGTVEIKGIAREAGARSKVAVWTDQENIDPIGSCIGQRGARVHTIISELKGEKIDIILYDDDPQVYIKNSLSPAKILEIKINDKEKTSLATVAEDQLSLAIGKSGQNVRLAAKLTGWKIDIISDKGEKITPENLDGETDEKKTEEKPAAENPEKKPEKKDKPEKKTKAKKKK